MYVSRAAHFKFLRLNGWIEPEKFLLFHIVRPQRLSQTKNCEARTYAELRGILIREYLLHVCAIRDCGAFCVIVKEFVQLVVVCGELELPIFTPTEILGTLCDIAGV